MALIRDTLLAARLQLQKAGCDSPDMESEMMLAHALGVSRSALIAMRGSELAPEHAGRFERLLGRRVAREPLAYILGSTEFYGRRFEVTPATLIPRVDTEVLVDQALKRLTRADPTADPSDDIPDVLELGVGSGCIILSLLAERPGIRGYGVDISPAALDVARRNSSAICPGARLELALSDWFAAVPEPWRGRLPMIVSNPPYISEAERGDLQPEVRDHEPATALFTTDNGLRAPTRILEESSRWLRPGGWLLMEIGFGQSTALLAHARRFPYSEVHMVADTAGVARVLCARAQT